MPPRSVPPSRLQIIQLGMDGFKILMFRIADFHGFAPFKGTQREIRGVQSEKVAICSEIDLEIAVKTGFRP